MKKTIYLILFICINNVALSQNHGFSFNSILRDNNGNPITNMEVDIVINIYQNNYNGTPLYEENYFGYETNFLGGYSFQEWSTKSPSYPSAVFCRSF